MSNRRINSARAFLEALAKGLPSFSTVKGPLSHMRKPGASSPDRNCRICGRLTLAMTLS
jgi:hypothetical protein